MAVPSPEIRWVGAPKGKYTPGRSLPITRITFHHIVGDASAGIAELKNPKRDFSANYFIGSDGQIYQAVNNGDTAHADGNFASNKRTLSIECAGGHPKVPYTEPMYRAVAWLTAYLIDRFGINDFKRHREVSLIPTACPGAMDVERIIREAKSIVDDSRRPPAPLPKPAPPSQSRYERLQPSVQLRYNINGNIWNLSATKWPDFMSVGTFKAGDVFTAVGTAKHALGGLYYMTEENFGDADKTGVPRFNVGVNAKDVSTYVPPVEATPVPAPSPTPPPEPEIKPVLTPPTTIEHTTPEPEPAPQPATPEIPATPEVKPEPAPEVKPPEGRTDQVETNRLSFLRRLLEVLLVILTLGIKKKR